MNQHQYQMNPYQQQIFQQNMYHPNNFQNHQQQQYLNPNFINQASHYIITQRISTDFSEFYLLFIEKI